MPNKLQAITWTNDDHDHGQNMVSLDHNELKHIIQIHSFADLGFGKLRTSVMGIRNEKKKKNPKLVHGIDTLSESNMLQGC